jgi:hypothetical protein
LIFFLIALATGTAWMIGEHVLACLDLNTSALAGHRDILSVIFLLSTVAFAVTFEADALSRELDTAHRDAEPKVNERHQR